MIHKDLPLIDLHRHLDGNVRLETILDLGRKHNLPLPAQDVEGLRQLRGKTTHPIALHFGNTPFPTVVRQEVCDGFVIGGGVQRDHAKLWSASGKLPSLTACT